MCFLSNICSHIVLCVMVNELLLDLTDLREYSNAEYYLVTCYS